MCMPSTFCIVFPNVLSYSRSFAMHLLFLLLASYASNFETTLVCSRVAHFLRHGIQVPAVSARRGTDYYKKRILL